MSSFGNETAGFVLPRPGKALKWVLITLFAVWLMFALAINWGGASMGLFLLLCGDSEALFAGQIWRIFTAPLMHTPSESIGHILSALIGLFFLAPSLESAWGPKRFLGFLFFSSLFAYGVQALLEVLLPATLSTKLVPMGVWFGAFPAVEAVAIAWALSFKGRTVRLFFVLPVSSKGLILFVIGFSLMALIAASQTPSGHIAPFAGMLAGWLLGGGTPSPARRFYLQLKLARLDAETRQNRQRAKAERRQRIERSKLKVIRRDDDDDSGNGKSGNGGANGSGGRFLN